MSESGGMDLKGVVHLRINKVVELGAEAKFSPTEKIAKLPWRLEVLKSAGEDRHSPPTLAVYVWSNWANKSNSWSCRAIVKFIIKSRELDFVRNFEHNFCAKQPFVNWTRLLDPGSGNYSSQDNKEYEDSSLEIEAQICVKEIIGYGVPTKEDQIFVNGNVFAVNKFLLAAHSPYFRAFFFEDRFRECQTQTFEINDKEVDVEMFGIMLSCIYPDNGKPNDNNVETILQLCDKYDLQVVKERCERFLIEGSQKCFVFKYRMAEQYGLSSLKCHCLNSINTNEFCARLLENIAEFSELNANSQKVLDFHLAKVSESEKSEQSLASILKIGLLMRQNAKK